MGWDSYSTSIIHRSIHRVLFKLAWNIYIYMLFAGWEVRIVKNCDRGLENAARGRRPQAEGSIFKAEVTVCNDMDRPKAGK